MAGPVVQGIDTLTSAMKCNIIPDQEYLLQGSLVDSQIDVFKHRLRGLCDNTLGGEEHFCEREMVFSIRYYIF
jgi:mediator of RNA polymerase II transcription subunit 18